MKPCLLTTVLLGLLLFMGAFPRAVLAQTSSQQVSALEDRVAQLENRTRSYGTHADEGVVLMLAGAFCALWAQNTGRNAWLWFFLGMLFNVITLLVLLYKNSQDKLERARGIS
ncbi:MAG TPA: hypothetical protein VNZ22_11880 [Bacillota bacterium]|nr:hypothetical protein [Bacillota bacterium]